MQDGIFNFLLFLPTKTIFLTTIVLKDEITDRVGESFTILCCRVHVFIQYVYK